MEPRSKESSRAAPIRGQGLDRVDIEVIIGMVVTDTEGIPPVVTDMGGMLLLVTDTVAIPMEATDTGDIRMEATAMGGIIPTTGRITIILAVSG